MSDPLDAVFRPRAVAIVGASHDPTKRGYQAVRALQEAGYSGLIQPVNPRGGELLGLPVTRSIAELDPVPDLALVSTPAATVPQVIEECAARGIRAAVVLALGFAESGAAGAQLEARLRDVVRRTGVRVVGPNTSGILNMPIGLNLIGARGARPGGIALLVQSGNMALSLLNQTANGQHEGISICVGAGNQVDLTFADYLRYLNCDDNTRVIAMYVEGLGDGRAFYQAASDPARRKPIVLLKGGRSGRGQSAARSHTGAVAGEYAVVRAALAQAGVIQVRRTDELFAVAETLARQPPLRGGVAVLSDGGGHATLAADALSELHAPLATLSEQTETALRTLLGPNASVQNPVDLAGSSDAAPLIFAQALELLQRDEGVGGVLVVGLFGGYALRFSAALAQEESETARELVQLAASAGKPLIVHSLYAGHRSEPLEILRQGNVPVIESLEIACRCVAAAAEWGQARIGPAQRSYSSPSPYSNPSPSPYSYPSPSLFAGAGKRTGGGEGEGEGEGEGGGAGAGEGGGAAEEAGEGAGAGAGAGLLETEARELVMRAGVPVVPARFCRSELDVVDALREVSGPVALKVVSPTIAHKSDVGGVRLSLTSADDVMRAFRELLALSSDVRGVLVSPMLPRPQAEVLVGARRDAQFGPIITVGLGGTLVELQQAVAIRVLPIARADAESMIDETILGELLRGVRGQQAANREALVDLILGVAATFLANAELADLELNPVFVNGNGAVAVDARAFLRGDP